MSAASISFFASAVIALLAALAAVIARRRERALAGAAICFAALLVPLVQLGASAVAAVILLTAALLVLVLGMLARLDAHEVGRDPRGAIAYWLPAGLGLLGFVWVLLATGSRQVVDLGKPLPPGSRFADGSALLIGLGNEFVVPTLLVGLLALASVIAAVLGLVGGRVGEA
jgi:NADH:ubiquinone oxidoreductase subunit 6 (subunit J)